MGFTMTAQPSSRLESKSQENAEHCERLAAVMLSKAQRDSYLDLASMWRKLATEAVDHRLRVEAWRRSVRRPPSASSAAAAGADAGGEVLTDAG